MTPDINVLLAAWRIDHAHHAPALRWLNQAILNCARGGSIEVLPMVSAGFLRLVTNPKVFTSPAPIRMATEFIDSLLSIPGVEMPQIGREWPIFKQMGNEHGLAANDIPDAWIAATVRTINSHLVTFDRGFRRLLGRSELTVLSIN